LDLNLLETTILGLLALIAGLLVFAIYLVRKRVRPMPNAELAEVKRLIEGLESRLQTMSANNNVSSEVKAMCQDLQSKLEKWEESHAVGKGMSVETSSYNTRLNEALSNLEFLTQYFKIQDGINEYGSRILSAYDAFISRVDDEFNALGSGNVQGREYVLRSSMLLFALMMARVYLWVFGKPDSLDMVNEYLERAKRL